MNEYHRFVQLVYEACHASEAVDYFDLRGEIPENLAAFCWLDIEQQTAFLALAKHVRDHAEAIIAHIGEPPLSGNPPSATLLRTDELRQARHRFLSRYAVETERAASQAATERQNAV